MCEKQRQLKDIENKLLHKLSISQLATHMGKYIWDEAKITLKNSLYQKNGKMNGC